MLNIQAAKYNFILIYVVNFFLFMEKYKIAPISSFWIIFPK